MTRRLILFAAAVAPALFAANKVVDAALKKSKEGKHEEAIADLDAELKKNPKDAEVKKALGQAHFALGEKFMFDDAMPPMRKYPAALREFRKTATFDPDHKKAKEHIATIEGIYKSMGRPVPQ